MTTFITKHRVWHFRYLLSALLLCSLVALRPNAAQAQFGASLNFDGANDYAEVTTDPVPYGAASYTKEAWIRVLNNTNPLPNILTAGFDGASVRHFLYVNNGRLTAGHNLNFTELQSPPTTLVPLNQWVHVAVTYDHNSPGLGIGTMRLYQDGQLVATNTNVAQIAGAPLSLNIGRYITGNTPNHFFGDIDEVRIWNVVRTPEQIKQFRKCELTGAEVGLVAYYRFNQGIGGGNNLGITTLTATTGANGSLNNFEKTGATSNFTAARGVVTGSKYSIWDGTAWAPNGAPTNTDVTIIDSSTPSQPGNINTGSLFVTAGVTHSIAAGQSVSVDNDFDYSGATVEVLTGGSFLQTNNSTDANIMSTGISRFRVVRTDGKNNVGYNFISSPVGGITMGNIGNNSNFTTFRFRHDPTLGGGGARWIPVPSAEVLVEGAGYTYVQPAPGGTFTYENADGIAGRPGNGNVNVNLTGQVGYRYNLVGNPFPSPINMLTFFNNNTASITDLNFWQDNNNGTGSGSYLAKTAVNITGGDLIAVGQGFFVNAVTAPQPLTFSNAQRVSGNVALLRTEGDMERFKMTVSRDGAKDELWVAFSDRFTNQIESGFDAAKLEGNQVISLAARMGDDRLAIAALPTPQSGKSFELPLNLMVRSSGSYAFTSEDAPNPTGEKLFLEDRTTGEFYFLQVGKTHTLNLQAGNYRDRFFLRKSNEVKGAQLGESANAYAFDNSLFVRTTETAQVALFNTMGTQIQRFANVAAGDARSLAVNVPTAGVYIVKIYTSSGVSESRVWLER